MTIAASKTGRGKFQFSNAAAQRAEAALNTKEARAIVQRWVPSHLRESSAPPAPPTSETGKTFRRVVAILNGAERKK